MVEADARRPDELFARPAVRDGLDLDRPLGIVMTGLMVFVGDHEDPVGLMEAYRDVCAPGSHIALSQLTDERADPETLQVHARIPTGSPAHHLGYGAVGRVD